jgi:hypothetical protein
LPVVDVWLVTKNVIGCAVGADGEESLLHALATRTAMRENRFTSSTFPPGRTGRKDCISGERLERPC